MASYVFESRWSTNSGGGGGGGGGWWWVGGGVVGVVVVAVGTRVLTLWAPQILAVDRLFRIFLSAAKVPRKNLCCQPLFKNV